MMRFLIVCNLAFSSLAAVALQRPAFAGKSVEAELRTVLSSKVAPGARLEIQALFCQTPIPAQATLQTEVAQLPLGRSLFVYGWRKGAGDVAMRSTCEATVRLYQPVAVARTALKNGDTFSDSSTAFEEREISPFAHSGYFTRLADLSESQVVGFLRPGTVITPMHVQRVKEISAGQMVNVAKRVGALTLSVQMRALESGQRHQWIRVQNQQSKKVVVARVSGAGRAEIQ